MTRTGIAFCATYLVLSTTSVLLGLSSDDSKSRFVLFQLPIGMQLSALDAIGLRPILQAMSWLVAYVVIVPLTLAVLYLAGGLLGHLVSSSFRVLSDALRSELRRTKRATLSDIMAAALQQSRIKPSLLTAVGFGVLIAILAVLAMSTPIVGLFIYGALYFASPFTWAWALVAGLDAPWPVGRPYLPLLFAAPFPLVGLFVGYIWPFQLESSEHALRAIGLRFAVSLIVLGVIGAVLFVAALHW